MKTKLTKSKSRRINLTPATVALYFNLAAGEKHQLEPHEQTLLKVCMEKTFPVLKQGSRKMTASMPTPKKPLPVKQLLWWGAVSLFISFVALLLLLSGCEISGYGDPLAIFKYPDMLWRDLVIQPPINYDWYYFLVDEYDTIDQRPPFQFLYCVDFWGA